MIPNEQPHSPRLRINSPTLKMSKIKRTDSTEGINFDLQSPTISILPSSKLPEPKTKSTIQQSFPQSQLKETKPISQQRQSAKRLNSFQKAMVSNLVKIFIADQQEKPQKVFVKLDGMSSNLHLPIQAEGCRIDRIELCRYDPKTRERNSEEAELDESVFSFADVPQISKIVVCQPPAVKPNKVDLKKGTLKKNVMAKRQGGAMRIFPTLSVTYLPYSKAECYTKFKKQSKESSVISRQSFISSEVQQATNIDHLQTVVLTKLVKLDLQQQRRKLGEANSANTKTAGVRTLNEYEELKKSKNEQLKQKQQQIQDFKAIMSKKTDEFEQMIKTNRNLSKIIDKLKDKIFHLQTKCQNGEAANKELILKVEEYKNIVRKLRIEENGKGVKESKTSKRSTERPGKNQMEFDCLPTMVLKDNDKPLSNKMLPPQQSIGQTGFVQTERPSAVYLVNREAPTMDHYFDVPRTSTSQLTSNNGYYISNPKVQEELRMFKLKQVSKRSSNMVGVKKNQVISPSSPAETSRMVRGHKSSDHILSPRQQQDLSEDRFSSSKMSDVSGKTNKSLHSKIGHIVKYNNAREGMLVDYMLSGPEPPKEATVEKAQSRFRDKDENSSNGSEKKRFRYKFGA